MFNDLIIVPTIFSILMSQSHLSHRESPPFTDCTRTSTIVQHPPHSSTSISHQHRMPIISNSSKKRMLINSFKFAEWSIPLRQKRIEHVHHQWNSNAEPLSPPFEMNSRFVVDIQTRSVNRLNGNQSVASDEFDGRIVPSDRTKQINTLTERSLQIQTPASLAQSTKRKIDLNFFFSFHFGEANDNFLVVQS